MTQQSSHTTETRNSEKKKLPPWSLAESPHLHLDNLGGMERVCWGVSGKLKSQPQAECLYWHLHLYTVNCPAFIFMTLFSPLSNCALNPSYNPSTLFAPLKFHRCVIQGRASKLCSFKATHTPNPIKKNPCSPNCKPPQPPDKISTLTQWILPKF